MKEKNSNGSHNLLFLETSRIIMEVPGQHVVEVVGLNRGVVAVIVWVPFRKRDGRAGPRDPEPTAFMPADGEHPARIPFYSNVSRGNRRKAQGEATTAIVESSEISPSEAKRAWARRSTELAEA